jgi:glyoxylase-like metal-dependent hydrolase (beta-lactamase superfamily II)
MEGGLRAISPGIWVYEEPLSFRGFEMGRRMTVIRLGDGALLVHSPAALSAGLREELDRLGEVRFVVPASILHGHLYMEHYREAYPGARLYTVPGLESKRPELDFDGELRGSPEPEWSADLDQKRFEGHRLGARVLNEVEFFHRGSRTLITGDLCFNVGRDLPLKTRLLAWGPRMRPRLGPTVAFRLGIRDREAARASVLAMLEWDFDRLIPGHGEIVESGAKAALEDGLAWLLKA